MDERLEAGRHHLHNGDKALREGCVDESRTHFGAALLQFRGPELRLGEGHALRGLAHVERVLGQLQSAERCAREAIEAYQMVQTLLRQLDVEGVSVELQRDAEEGEGSAWVLLGDIHLQQGRNDDAHTALDTGRRIYDNLGEVPSAAEVWTLLGRLALRSGRLEQAREALARSDAMMTASGDQEGRVTVQLMMADVERMSGALDGALTRALAAEATVRSVGDGRLLGRCLMVLGATRVQLGQLQDAREAYEGAVEAARSAGDWELEGMARTGLADALFRLDDAASLTCLVDGARILAELGHGQGLGLAMLQAAKHGMALHHPALALVSAECARQRFLGTDPHRGVGQALRLQVKVLAEGRCWAGVLAVSHARANLLGDASPNAQAVRDHYRDRAPADMLATLDALDAEACATRAEDLVEQAMGPILGALELDAASLFSAGACMHVLRALVDVSRRATGGLGDPEPEGPSEAAQTPAAGADAVGLYASPLASSWDDADDDFEDEPL